MSTSQPPFDCTVRCEVVVPDRRGREEAAEAAFQDHGCPFRKLAPRRYHVDVAVLGSRTGASVRAQQELLAELSRRGVNARVVSAVRLDVPDQRGEQLAVYEKRRSRFPRLERLLVVLGLRDTGDTIQASHRRQADHRLMLLVSSLERPEELAWRRRLGRSRLPDAEEPPQREPVGRIIAASVVVFAAGNAAALSPFPLALFLTFLALLLTIASAWWLASVRKSPEWGIGPVLLAGLGYLAGHVTAPKAWWILPFSGITILAGTGLRHLIRDLSLVQQVPWVFPIILPLIVPLTAYVGDLAYGCYLDALGLSREAVTLGLWDRLAAAALPVGVAFVASLGFLAVLGWFRYWHLKVPIALSVLTIVVYFVSGMVSAAHEGIVAGTRPARGFFALSPEWMCATGVEDEIPTWGAPLPVPPKPLLTLELVNGQVALWDLSLGPERGLIKVPADKVRLVRVTDATSSCQ